MTYVELNQRLSELLLMRLDRITMASSVEGRDPFLDHRLVEFVVALPPQMKYRDGNGKYVLKRATRGTLPDEILDRRRQGRLSALLRGRLGCVQNAVEPPVDRDRDLLPIGGGHMQVRPAFELQVVRFGGRALVALVLGLRR
jgi:asparagine synthetase B (glutamine-hydrolysing)